MKMAKETWIQGKCQGVEACPRKNKSKKAYQLVKDLTTEKQGKSTAWASAWAQAKTLIRLGGCPGWSESSLRVQSFCWFCRWAAQILFKCLLCGRSLKRFIKFVMKRVTFKWRQWRNVYTAVKWSGYFLSDTFIMCFVISCLRCFIK